MAVVSGRGETLFGVHLTYGWARSSTKYPHKIGPVIYFHAAKK
ncbi:MAG: hypothetical protein JWO59_3450 [Chloroflexi bacterium]|nr:hypothetical protein [Chloroflexota bacterium]